MDKHEQEHDGELPPSELMADVAIIAKLALFFKLERKRSDLAAVLIGVAGASLSNGDLKDLAKVMIKFAEDHNCEASIQKVDSDGHTIHDGGSIEPNTANPEVKLTKDDYAPSEANPFN